MSLLTGLGDSGRRDCHAANWLPAHPLAPQVLLRAASKDPEESCRDAARTALAALPLPAEVLLPLLAEGAGRAEPGGDVEMADAADADEEQDEVLQQLVAEAAALQQRLAARLAPAANQLGA